jgi:membrane protease subunit HflC
MQPSPDQPRSYLWRIRRRTVLLGVTVSVLAITAGFFCFFSVDSTEYALVTEFGAPKRTITAPGLYTKLPYQTVRRLDNRLAVFVPPPSEFLTLEKTPVVASTALIWRISDPKRFVETVFDQDGATSRLGDILYAELGAVLGSHSLEDFVSVDPGRYHAAAILNEVRTRCAEIAERDYGIELLNVALRNFDFPKQNRDRLYARMKSERARLSMAYRSEGEEQAIKIGARAEEERSRLLASGLERAQATRAEGDGEAARIAADAFGAAPDFYAFLRSLDASKRLVRKDTTMVLPADSELFSLLLDSRGLQHEPPAGEAVVGTDKRAIGAKEVPPR